MDIFGRRRASFWRSALVRRPEHDQGGYGDHRQRGIRAVQLRSLSTLVEVK
jgi:hypothetical protein